MTPDEFRQAGHSLIDWIADYREKIPELPVRAQVEPGDIRRALPSHPPQERDTFSAVLADLERAIVPGVTQVQHPMHFGWFPSNASLASVLGDIASSGMGTLGISWESWPVSVTITCVMSMKTPIAGRCCPRHWPRPSSRTWRQATFQRVSYAQWAQRAPPAG